MGNAYRSTIHINEKRYCVLDLLDDGLESEGEKLPEPGLETWETALSKTPTGEVEEVFQLANLPLETVSKLIWLRLDSVSAGTYGFEGYVFSREGRTGIGQPVFEACAPQGGGLPVEDLADSIAGVSPGSKE